MTERKAKYLYDILYATELIEGFISETELYSQYISDIKTQSAVGRQLAIIGEAVNKYNTFVDDNHRLDAATVALRNRLVHAYDAIDSSNYMGNH